MLSMRIVLLTAVVVFVCGFNPARAATWSSNSVSFLYGSGYELASSEDATIITTEHASGWTYGDNFIFFDIFQPFAGDTDIYGEWHPRFSFGKMSGNDLSFGIVKDVLLATELNVGHQWRAYLYGVGFDLDVPHFQFFALNIFVRDEMTLEGSSTYQISPSWNLPFKLGQAQLEFAGFADYAGPAGGGKANLMTQPQLLLDVSSFQGNPGRFYVGVEYRYFMNKFGIDGVNESVMQLMGKWVF